MWEEAAKGEALDGGSDKTSRVPEMPGHENA